MSDKYKWLLKLDHYPEFEVYGVSPLQETGQHSRLFPVLWAGITFHLQGGTPAFFLLYQYRLSGFRFQQAKLRLMEASGPQGQFRQLHAYLLSDVLVEQAITSTNSSDWYFDLSCKSSRMTA